jgi:hypothetical protein
MNTVIFAYSQKIKNTSKYKVTPKSNSLLYVFKFTVFELDTKENNFYCREDFPQIELLLDGSGIL